ncbi:MAG: cytochrome c oxidase cbb3-type subunit 1 [Rickettsiales bacterium]|jgi:cytochrome c oxidase cbb3-type subunit 1
MSSGSQNHHQNYNYDIVKLFTIAATFWGIFGFTIGVTIALQMTFPSLNLSSYSIGEYFSFGRLRPLHTSSVIFAFGGNVLFATSFFVVQRTSQARLWGSDGLLKFIFWGYQAFLIVAASGYIFGVTQAKEYAEPEWYADLWLTIIWICYFLVFVLTLKKRKEPHIYVANWFFLGFIVTFAILHIVNNLSIPLRLDGTASYPIFGGVQSAMIQWWYGHNAVGFFLTAGFLGIMYYFIPKRAQQPVYSYRLSILHFWSLIFIYIWAGPHHLHYTSLPDWAQTLGMTFSIILWMPSWGGMLNGLLTLSGAWHKLRTDPVLRFLITAVAFYGMSTFEGPVMAIRSVNALSHYTEWTIGHVHSGALGWVAMISFGALYHLVPVLWNKKDIYSIKWISVHFWLATIGIVLYITALWVGGIMQGLMWRSYDEMGFLQYSFVESVSAMHPIYFIRAVGGMFFLSGALLMAYNFYKTIRYAPSNNQTLTEK